MGNDEINRLLALAIGWIDDRIGDDGSPDPDVIIDSERGVLVWMNTHWREFSYCDPTVIWPVAEKYDVFPERCAGGWVSMRKRVLPEPSQRFYADSAEKAVALAVIGAI